MHGGERRRPALDTDFDGAAARIRDKVEVLNEISDGGFRVFYRL
ncbi:hypothetical protein ACFCW4_20755 [Streptomyces virginiae]